MSQAQRKMTDEAEVLKTPAVEAEEPKKIEPTPEAPMQPESPHENKKNTIQDKPQENGDMNNQKQAEKEQEQNEGDEEDQDEDQEEKDAQNQAKSGRKESSEERDDSHPNNSSGKKCFNKLCNVKKIHKKIRSKVETSRYRFLCKSCYDNYLNNSFCEFCQQIYTNYENEEEDTKWVGCDKCDRWNHIECERKYRHKNFQISKDKDTQYECLACSKKVKNGLAANQNQKRKHSDRQIRHESDGTKSYRAKMQISKDERTPIFYKKPQSFPFLESFLQSYNFRLWLNDTNIREDIELLRSSQGSKNSTRRPLLDEEPKKVKKVKLDY